MTRATLVDKDRWEQIGTANFSLTAAYFALLLHIFLTFGFFLHETYAKGQVLMIDAFFTGARTSPCCRCNQGEVACGAPRELSLHPILTVNALLKLSAF